MTNTNRVKISRDGEQLQITLTMDELDKTMQRLFDLEMYTKEKFAKKSFDKDNANYKSIKFSNGSFKLHYEDRRVRALAEFWQSICFEYEDLKNLGNSIPEDKLMDKKLPKKELGKPGKFWKVWWE